MIDSGGGTDTRKVLGESCQDVEQALSLTAALALDPSASTATAPAAAAQNPVAPTSPTVPAAAPTEIPAAATRPVAVEGPAARPSPRVPAVEFGGGPVGLGVLSDRLSPGISLAVRKNLSGDSAFRPTLGLAMVYARSDLLPSQRIAQAAL
ncbi:MAG TPA: hypothetical protein VF518_02210, partial [Polyangia bacterium]